MALDNISFSPVNDIHLLRGQSIDLLALLRVGSQTATNFKTANPTVTYAFTPFFKKISGAGTQHSGFNITVDTQTGVITTQVAVPSTEKRNFLVKAVATLGSESRETYIRIHIHHAISEAWLSPAILTVPQGMSGFRFSVRVKFDDDVVAEIGDISNGTFTTNNNLFTITWNHPTPGHVDPATGAITSSATSTIGMLPDDVEATITVPALGVTRTATGRVFIASQLSGTRSDITAELVTTGNCPGFSRAHEVPNVLFIPDGFSIGDDSGLFDQIVDNYVSELVGGKITSPFDILAGSINFWKVFITGERGVTTRSEVYVKEKDGNPVGVPFMKPVKPLREDGTENTNGAEWYYYHLFYHVGLPVRADKNRDSSSLRNEWKQATLLSTAQVDDITNDAIDNWKKTAERRLPEEPDTALGLLVNDYTAANNDGDFEMVVFNGAKRMSRSRLDKFLATLKDSNGNNIGKSFAQSSPWVTGKDYDNVVFVVAAPRARENNFDGGFFIAIKEWVGYYNMESGSLTNLKVSVKFDNEIEELPLYKRAVLTHELGHSFALEDEYGEPTPTDNYNDKFINDPLVSGWSFSRFTGGASVMDWSGNVEARNDLLTPNPNNPSTAMLDANKIKWRYHRIEKCGVVAANISPTASQYTVTLRQGQANVFATADKVFLRKRVWYKHTLERFAAGPVSAVSQKDVLTVAPDGIRHKEATVTNVNTPSNQITISDVDNNSFTITFRASGSAGLFNVNDTVNVERRIPDEPIFSITRTPPPARYRICHV